MVKIKSENILGTGNISKLLRDFALPSIIALLASSFYNLIDQIFIGNSVGMLGNAATNIAFPLTTICTSVALFIGVGTAANFNISLGRKDRDSAKTYISNAVIISVIFSLLITLFTNLFLEKMLYIFGATDEILTYAKEYVSITSYGFIFLICVNVGSTLIRADGAPKFSMMCMIVGIIINLIFDPILIFGFNMGMKGAAIATIFGQFISFLMVVFYFKRYMSVKIKINDLKLKIFYATNIMKLGAASGLNQIALLFVQIVFNNLYKYYGAASIYGSEIPLAAVGIALKVNMIYFSICIGLSQGLQPIASYNYGAKKYDRVIEVYKKAFKNVLIISIIFFLIFQIFPQYILNIFGDGNKLYYKFGIKFFRIFLFTTFINGLQPITMGFFSAIGKAHKGIFISLSRQVIFIMPAVIILSRLYGIDGMLYSGPIADVLGFIVVIILISRELKAIKKLS